MYNMTNITNANNIFDVVVAVNGSSNGMLGILMLLTIFMVFFITFKQYEGDIWTVFIASNAVTSIIAILMWAGGLIGINILIWPLLLLISGIIGYMLK